MLNLKNFIALCCLSAQIQFGFAQLTIKVTSIPNNTPAGSTIYAVGTFNNWAPADPTKKLTLNSDGTYSITLTPPVGQVKMKFTRGSWPTVEGDVNGNFLPDRVFNYTLPLALGPSSFRLDRGSCSTMSEISAAQTGIV